MERVDICIFYGIRDPSLTGWLGLMKICSSILQMLFISNEDITPRSRNEKVNFLIVWDFSKAETWQKERRADPKKKGFCHVDPQGFRITKALSNCMQCTWTIAENPSVSMCLLTKFWKLLILHLHSVLNQVDPKTTSLIY